MAQMTLFTTEKILNWPINTVTDMASSSTQVVHALIGSHCSCICI